MSADEGQQTLERLWKDGRKNTTAFIGRPSNPFGSGAQIQWRASGKLTDFEVPRHLLQYNIIYLLNGVAKSVSRLLG